MQSDKKHLAKSWLWVIDALYPRDLRYDCCVNILDVVVVYEGVPVKLIYTDSHGRVGVIKRPELTIELII